MAALAHLESLQARPDHISSVTSSLPQDGSKENHIVAYLGAFLT